MQHRERRSPGTCVPSPPTLVRGTRVPPVPYDPAVGTARRGRGLLDTPRAANDATGIGATAISRALPPSLVFGSAIGLSAFLLFTVQPLVGRLLLPAYGGAPAVWATVLAFFQVVLLGGYAYAHVVATRMSPNRGAALHIAILCAALVFTLLTPTSVAALFDPAEPTIPGLVRVLVLLIGAPAFVLTATTPLVSTWYARVRHATDPDGDPREPYWLYALSNGGSLVSLLAYPLLIEGQIGLSQQRSLWIAGVFVLLGLLVVAGAVQATRLAGAGLTMPTRGTDLVSVPADEVQAPTRRLRLRWIALAAIPAGLLSAVTNQVTTDLISAPLLWVIPLAIYLASFVIVFSARGRRLVPFAIIAAPAALTLLWIPIGSSGIWPIVPLLVVEYLGLGVAAVALHGRLAESRPPDRHLTEFYLLMSTGGALGGLFVAIVAPLAFDGVWELPILIVAALAALALTADPLPRMRPSRRMLHGAVPRMGPYLVVVIPLLLLVAQGGDTAFTAAWRWALVGGLVLLFGGDGKFLVLTTAVVLILATFVLAPAAVFRDRSFFGVTEVLRSETETVLMHGTTAHGRQPVGAAAGSDPGSYYAASGPIGDVFRATAANPGRRIVVVGLGAGAIATYARPDDDLVFFEIDPLVAGVARDPAMFTYLDDREPTPSVEIGDGRLLLAASASGSTDVIVLDAFSSDSPPTHLLTAEAIADAGRVLAGDGLVAVHVSNRYYDLVPPVAAALHEAGLTPLVRAYEPTEDERAGGASPSVWVIGTRDAATLEALRSAGWSTPPVADTPLRDDFPDLMRWFAW